MPDAVGLRGALDKNNPKKENGRVYLAPFYEALNGEVELANPDQFSSAEQ